MVTSQERSVAFLWIMVFAFTFFVQSTEAFSQSINVPTQLRGCWVGLTDQNEQIEMSSTEYTQGDGVCRIRNARTHRHGTELLPQWFVAWRCENGDENTKASTRTEVYSLEKTNFGEVMIRYGHMYDDKRLLIYKGLQENEWVFSATSERWEHACEHLEPQIFLVA